MPSFDGRPCVVENCRRAEANLLGEAIVVVVEAGSIEGSEDGEAAAVEKALLRAMPRPGARIEAIGVILGEVEPGDGQLVRIVAIKARLWWCNGLVDARASFELFAESAHECQQHMRTVFCTGD